MMGGSEWKFTAHYSDEQLRSVTIMTGDRFDCENRLEKERNFFKWSDHFRQVSTF